VFGIETDSKEGFFDQAKNLLLDHMVLESIMHQFRIGFHLHLLQNAGSVSTDRLHTQKRSSATCVTVLPEAIRRKHLKFTI